MRPQENPHFAAESAAGSVAAGWVRRYNVGSDVENAFTFRAFAMKTLIFELLMLGAAIAGHARGAALTPGVYRIDAGSYLTAVQRAEAGPNKRIERKIRACLLCSGRCHVCRGVARGEICRTRAQQGAVPDSGRLQGRCRAWRTVLHCLCPARRERLFNRRSVLCWRGSAVRSDTCKLYSAAAAAAQGSGRHSYPAGTYSHSGRQGRLPARLRPGWLR